MRYLSSTVTRFLGFYGLSVMAALLAGSVRGQMVPPVITVQPQSQTVLIGSNATFSVTATGANPLNYVWFVNGSPVASGTDSTYTVTTAQAFNAADYQVGILGSDGGYTVSSIATLTVNTQAVTLLNVDFGTGAVSPKTGPAAVGQTSNDFWNFYSRDDGSGGFLTYRLVPNLQLADGTPTGAALQVYNAPGAWANGVADPMYTTYVYSLSPQSTTVTLVLTNLSPGTFDFYIYGHEPNDSDISSYELLVDGASQGVKSSVGPGWNTNVWHEGVHYVPYRGVQIGSGQTVTIYVRPGNTGTSPYGVLSGLQIAQMQGPSIFPTAVLNGPTNLNVAAGSTNVISATVIGSAPLTNQWYFNGTPMVDDGVRISGSTTASLTISGVVTNDAGSYWLTVSNADGSATTATATWNVGDAPVITNQPQGQTVVVGGAATFSADGTGSQPLSYQWYLASTALTDDGHRTGSTNATLSIISTSGADAGSYSLVLSNAFGTATSVAVPLALLVPPSVTMPATRSVPAGLATTFTPSVSGSAPLSFQWQLNGSDLPGATLSALTIPTVGTSDLGSYRLVVTNGVGSVTSSNVVLTFGPVMCWGRNDNNQCLPLPGLTNVIGFAASSTYTDALRADGTVQSWGSTVSGSPPYRGNVLPALTNAVAVSDSTSPGYGVALLANGTTAEWGRSGPLHSNVVAVSAGYYTTLYLINDGTVATWTQNVPVPAGLTKVVAIADGVNQAVALRSDGTVVAWAHGSGPAATNVPVGLANVVAVASGYEHCLALKSDGTVVAWGIGIATNIPHLLTASNAPKVMAIAAGGYPAAPGHSMALLTNGTVVAWGDNAYGQTNVPAGLTNVVWITAGGYHCAALVNDGRPLIVQLPVGGTAWSQRNFALNAKAVGTAPLAYQWNFNGSAIQGATNSSLTLTNFVFSNAGTYQLIVTNTFGSATSVPVPVAFAERAPYVNVQPISRTANVGTTINLGIPINGSGPMHIQWRVAVTNPPPFGPGWINIPGATNEDFILSPVTVADMGAYSVTATNSLGVFISSTVTLTVRQVEAWGDYNYGKTNVPASLTNAIAICGGDLYNFVALRADGRAQQWGLGGTNTPTVASNLVEVAVGAENNQFFGLRTNGVPILWGPSGIVQPAPLTNALAAMSNIVAIEADTSGSTYLRTNGTITRLDPNGNVINIFGVGTNIIALSRFSGGNGFTALRSDGTFYSSAGTQYPLVTNVLSVMGNMYESVALKRDSTVQSWAQYTNAPLSNIVAVANTESQVNFAERADGTITNWGNRTSAMLNFPGDVVRPWTLEGGYDGGLALYTTNDFPPLFLSTALDTTNIVVSSRSSAQWYGQTRISHDGKHAGRSADLGSNTASSMRMYMVGPTNVSFWWKVSSEANHDFLTFSIGGVPRRSISGEVDWQQVTFTVPPGPQMLVWTYSKDAGGTAGMDAAFVDQLTFAPAPPVISSQPIDQTVLGPNAASLHATAYGATPLTYYWYKVGSGLQFVGPATYPINPTHRASSGTYYVVVNNSYGSTVSSNAVLTVHVPQTIAYPLLQPDGTFLVTSQDSDSGQFSSNTDVTPFTALYSSNLIDWLPLNAALSVSNGYLQFIDTDATNEPLRFYRVLENW